MNRLDLLLISGHAGTPGTAPPALRIPTDISLFEGPGLLQDHFPDDNCCSLADLNSTGIWTGNGASIGINTVDTAEQSDYSLSINSVAPLGEDYAQILAPTVALQVYEFIFWSKFIPGGLPNPNARCFFWQGADVSPNINLTNDVDWTRHQVQVTAAANPLYIRFWVVADTHDGNGDVLLIDRCVLQEVTI